MKKLLFISIALMFVAGSAIAQDETKPKKKGGFMKTLKKGVESTTGLKVSDETLFVYPKIGEWKMAVESCKGNKQTGEVVLKIKVTRITDREPSKICLLAAVEVTGGKALKFKNFSADPLYDFKPNETLEVTFQTITEVPEDAKTLDAKFFIGFRDNKFEVRRVPVAWE